MRLDRRRFERSLAELLDSRVDDVDDAEKVALVRKHADAYERGLRAGAPTLRFEPFVPGRRPGDEALYPGLGSSDPVALVRPGCATGDRLEVLMRLSKGGLLKRARLLATLEAVDAAGQRTFTVAGWERRDVTREVEPIGEPSTAAGEAGAALRLSIDAEATFADAPAAQDYLGFSRLWHQPYQLAVEVELEGVTVAADEYAFSVFDASRFGTLYQRLLERLLPVDLAEQTGADSPASRDLRVHPFYPVLCIGMEKAALYMKALTDDLVEEKRLLTDPAWLLRVGLYLEYLTCLGIATALRSQVELLTPEEWAALDGPELSPLRDRLDPEAWARVWELRHAALASSGTPSLLNLMRKKAATLGFLHAHHEDLKHAIELAGPNLHNAQETWHRVFRDAERAVLRMNEDAFPELSQLADTAREFALWHEAGSLGDLKYLPRAVSSALGDQDGVFPSACRQYRRSMNDIAAWARERGLMEFTGSECVPVGASLLEAHLQGREARVTSLQRRDGYVAALEVRHEDFTPRQAPLEEVVGALAELSIFDALSREELMALAAMMRPIHLGPLERILVQGREGSSLFVLQQGALEVLVQQGDDDVPVAVLHPPAVVGERAFLTGKAREATVRAIDEALVLELGASQLRPLVEARPAILERIAELLESRRESSRPKVRRSFIEQLRAAVFGPRV